jgi:hypothetical protein
MDCSGSNNDTQRASAVTFPRYERVIFVFGATTNAKSRRLEDLEIGIMYTNVENMLTPLSKVSLMFGK